MNYLINARKRGEPISVLFNLFYDKNQQLDEVYALSIVLSQCQKAGVHFNSFSSIERLFNKYYKKKFHGSKESYIKWLKRYLTPIKNHPCPHIDSKKLGDSRHFFSEDEENYDSQLNLTHSEGGKDE